RVLGLGSVPWRAFDPLAGILLTALPIGTRAARAALAGALVVAATGVVLYSVVSDLLGLCAATRRLRFAIAAIATSTALVAAPWQLESASVGGSVTGAFAILLAVALTARACTRAGEGAWAVAFGALGLAMGQEPLAGASSLGTCAVLVSASPSGRRAVAVLWKDRKRWVLGSLLAGLSPFLLALGRTLASGGSLPAALGTGWNGERGALGVGSLTVFAHTEVGPMLGALAIGGMTLGMLVAAARPMTAALSVLVAIGLGCGLVGAPVGPARFGSPLLAAYAAACALAAVAMQAVVRAVAQTRVPFAPMSAAMIVVLEAALPIAAADDALVRSRTRTSEAVAIWTDTAFGSMPPKSVVLVSEPLIFERAVVARAQGSLRSDLVVLPAFAQGGGQWLPFARDAALVPLWRDLALSGSPTEASLSSLASVRPLAMAYESRWGRAIGRHLVPLALFDTFEPEPRGGIDRRRAFDVYDASRKRLATLVGGEPELAAATVALLRARVLLMVDLGADRDLADRAARDVRAFEPQP
ncbi:MAG TPA: hypothetical protein VGY54_04565, partial [Polyangiaceae bacterium]|nr:hypothetical protein [Polyangiaceae bacterium]